MNQMEDFDLTEHVALCLRCGTIAATVSEPCESAVASRIPARVLASLHDVAERAGLEVAEAAVLLWSAGLSALDEGGEEARLDGLALARRLDGERPGAEVLRGDRENRPTPHLAG